VQFAGVHPKLFDTSSIQRQRRILGDRFGRISDFDP
jgi:hypothetical protein